MMEDYDKADMLQEEFEKVEAQFKSSSAALTAAEHSCVAHAHNSQAVWQHTN